MNQPPLSFENIGLPRSDGEAISLEVPAHSSTAVVGDDMSGVGFLGQYALGLESPPSGRALVFGENIATMDRRRSLAFRRAVGYLPAGDGLLQNLCLLDNIALPLRYGSDMREREMESRIEIMLTMMSLRSAAGLRPAQATEEERRRAALARALAFDPKLVILEQPFDGLPPKASAELLEIARGGETTEGCRRTVFITAQFIPERLRPRIEYHYRVTEGRIEPFT
ncbi:MAG: ATP-binding cassette domain-containing protein [Gemmatimonadales bacterium]